MSSATLMQVDDTVAIGYHWTYLMSNSSRLGPAHHPTSLPSVKPWLQGLEPSAIDPIQSLRLLLLGLQDASNKGSVR